MRKFQSLALAVLASISLGAMAQQGPVLFYGIMELSGTGATPGNNFDNWKFGRLQRIEQRHRRE